jgi:thiamine-monophosphate kinase
MTVDGGGASAPNRDKLGAPKEDTLEPPPGPERPARNAVSPVAVDRERAVIRRMMQVGPRLPSLRLGIGDDAAVLDDGTVVTVDALVEGVHWNDRLEPSDVGWKAVAASVSDCCAMGARPTWMVLALSLTGVDEAFVEGFAQGLDEAARAFGVALIGGDTTAARGARCVSITMAGRLVDEPWLRSGATPGDDIWVTGTLGLAGLGWMSAAPGPAALAALRRPMPPLAFVEKGPPVTAAMDLSDGLAADLPRLCEASGISAVIEPDLLPLSAEVRATPDPVLTAMVGGEDFQLLLCARPESAEALTAIAAVTGTRLTRVGRCGAGAGASLVGRPWPTPAFTHFPEPA